MCFVVICWERADLLALVRGVQLHFPIGILGQVWYLIVSIPDLCTLTYLVTLHVTTSAALLIQVCVATKQHIIQHVCYTDFLTNLFL